MNKIVFHIIVLALCSNYIYSQDDASVVQKSAVDTFYFKLLPEVSVYSLPKFENKRQKRKYTRLVRDVRITLPYAKRAALLMNEVNDTLQTILGEGPRKRFLKSKEKELFTEFERPLRSLTFSQGRLLLKLIDRECQNTSYEIVKLYRGGFSAFFWQSVAFVFGANLKSEYDAIGEDRMLEYVVRAFEKGQLMM